MSLTFEMTKINVDDPTFTESFGCFYADRAPDSDDDSYINSIPFGNTFTVFWRNQSTKDISQLTNWGDTPLIWQNIVTNLNLGSSIGGIGWQLNTSRNYSPSGISLNTSRQPSLTNDVFVNASINLVNILATTTTVTCEISPENSTWTTVGQIANTTGVASNTTQMIGFIVPQSYYYRLIGSGDGTMTLINCQELIF